MNSQKLEEKISFKYLGATLYKDGMCSAEDCIRVAAPVASMAILNRICWCNTISFASKFKLYMSVVTSILICCCETGILLADCEKRIQVFETRCLRKLLHICYLEHKTSNWPQSEINFLVGPQEPPLATVKRQKLAWFGHVTIHDSLSKTVLQGTLGGR